MGGARRGPGAHRMLRATVVVMATLAPYAATATATADVGFQGPTFTNGVVAPTGQKPQSKLWFHAGSWWGSLFVPGAGSNGEYRIHRLNAVAHSWEDTGVAIDDRNTSEADMLWDGQHLYAASSSDSVAGIFLYRYSYDAGAGEFALDQGFPVEIGTAAGPTEGVVLEKDTTGRLWVTFALEGTTEDGDVYVAHSAASDNAWAAPFPLPFPEAGNINGDDISALVAYEGKIGVIWSNQTDARIYFATHVDGAPTTSWTLEDPALEGPLSSDDHLNLKSLQADAAGRVFAAVKTSLGDNPANGAGAAQVVLLVLDEGGDWSQHVFGTVADDHTRPIVLTDQRRRRLYVFATAPTFADQGIQTIRFKHTSLDAPSFAPGPGQAFIQSDAGDDINNPTSTKQDLGLAPGLVVLASDDADYWHNTLSLDGGSTLPPPPPPTPCCAPPDRTRPVLTRVSVRPFAFRARRGSRLRFTLSERARVIVRLERRAPARRPRRSRFVRLRGSFSVTRRAGRGSTRLRGRLRGRALRPGRYRAVLVAVDAAGNRSRVKRAGFLVRR